MDFLYWISPLQYTGNTPRYDADWLTLDPNRKTGQICSAMCLTLFRRTSIKQGLIRDLMHCIYECVNARISHLMHLHNHIKFHHIIKLSDKV